MKSIPKGLVLVIAAAGFLGVAGSVLADDAAKAPIRLTDAQMDQVVAAGVFEDTIKTETTTTEYFRGYSNKTASGPGPGTSSAEVTTTITTVRTLDCPGADQNSCYSGQADGLNPQTDVLSSVSTTETSKAFLSGPGRSFDHRAF